MDYFFEMSATKLKTFVISVEWLHNRSVVLKTFINFYLLRTFCPPLGSFLCCFFFHYISAKFHLWRSSGDLPRPLIGMLSLVTVSPVITAFHSCCLPHYVFDQVNLISKWFQLKDITKFGTDPTMEDQIRRTNNWIYKTKKSIHDRPSGPAAGRGVESLRFQVSIVRR